MAIAVDQNYDKAQRKISTANLEQFAGVDCQLLVEKETHRPIIMDGSTIGGKFKCASTDELEAVKAKADSALPLTGGTVTGRVFFNTSSIFGYNTNEIKLLEVTGGNAVDAGAVLRLYENSDPNLAGMFSIGTGNEKYLEGYPSGNLLWAGKEVECVNTLGEYYIRYESGLQICWGSINIPAGQINTTVTLPVPYKDGSYVTHASYIDVNNTSIGATVVVDSNTVFRVSVTNAEGDYSWERFVIWSTIGRWK